jgi:3-hydroxy acid dehydrogenase/malonic semialdehyde reductase
MSTTPYVLITGASSGIGKACAQQCAALGKNLILVARRLEVMESMKIDLELQFGISALVYLVDLTDHSALEIFFDTIQNIEIEALINNAGLALGKSSFETYAWEDFDTMIDINIKAFTRVAQRTIPFLKRTQGHIINISSIAGIEAYEGGSVYCASKAYVKMISKALRIDLSGTGIRVTDVAPGAVDTEFSTVRFKGDAEKIENVYQGYLPLSANDIADTIVFALSRPKHVNIEYMLVMPTAQASATRVYTSS